MSLLAVLNFDARQRGGLLLLRKAPGSAEKRDQHQEQEIGETKPQHRPGLPEKRAQSPVMSAGNTVTNKMLPMIRPAPSADVGAPSDRKMAASHTTKTAAAKPKDLRNGRAVACAMRSPLAARLDPLPLRRQWRSFMTAARAAGDLAL
jgi:hypothetical protein